MVAGLQGHDSNQSGPRPCTHSDGRAGHAATRAWVPYDRTMRIMHLEAGRHLYGGAAQVRCLVDGLTRAGVDNLIVCPPASALGALPIDARVLEVPMRGELDIGLTVRLLRLIKRWSPDVVHVHSRRGADWYGGLAAALAGVPAVLTRRVDATEPPVVARLKHRPYAAVVVLSRAIETQVLRSGIAAARVVRIPSAVDAARFRPDPAARGRLLAAFGLPDDSLVVGCIAQLIERKRHSWLFGVLPDLVRALPQVRVLCFGRGPLKRRLRAELRERGLTAYVTLPGFRDDLPELVPGLDLLVHPAAREGLGLALLEAASAAVAAVACAAGGIADVIEHGRSGILVPVGDAAALRDALVRLLRDAPARARLGAAARAQVERRFNVAGLIDAHLSLYGRVLRERRVAAEPTVVP